MPLQIDERQPPLYAIRDLQAPALPRLPLPRSSLSSKVSPAAHDANIRRLATLGRGMTKPEFWSDAGVLDRLYYKNKNQHRQGAHFWKLGEARRILRRLKELDLNELIQNLLRAFYGGAVPKKMKGISESIPPRELMAYTVHRLIGAIILLEKAHAIFVEVYSHHAILLAQVQFASLALVVMSAASRLSILSRSWVTELEFLLELLTNWMEAFPSAGIPQSYDYELDIPKSLDEARRWALGQSKRSVSDGRPERPVGIMNTSSASISQTNSSLQNDADLDGLGEDAGMEDVGGGVAFVSAFLARRPVINQRFSPSEIVSESALFIRPRDSSSGFDRGATQREIPTERSPTAGGLGGAKAPPVVLADQLPPLSSLGSISPSSSPMNKGKSKKTEERGPRSQIAKKRRVEEEDRAPEDGLLEMPKGKNAEGRYSLGEERIVAGKIGKKKKKKIRGADEIDDIFGP